MAGHPARNLSVRCAVSQSGRATCESLRRGSPTAITVLRRSLQASPPSAPKACKGVMITTDVQRDPVELLCEDVMRQPQVCKHQVCDRCGGRFGMVTHRWWGNKFCRRTCKDAFLRENQRAARLILTTPAWPLKPRDWFMKP